MSNGNNSTNVMVHYFSNFTQNEYKTTLPSFHYLNFTQNGNSTLGPLVDLYVVEPQDIVVFVVLEILGIIGIFGNAATLVVLVSMKLYKKATFIIIGSLALADLWHNIHTSVYFYPPIITGYNIIPKWLYLIMNATDWMTWGITLTSEVAICLDRFVAVVLFKHYKNLL